MKKTLFVLLMALFPLCAMAQAVANQRVEVVYFHGKQRCITCMAIEKAAREVVEKDFAKEKRRKVKIWQRTSASHGHGSLSTVGKTVRKSVTT